MQRPVRPVVPLAAPPVHCVGSPSSACFPPQSVLKLSVNTFSAKAECQGRRAGPGLPGLPALVRGTDLLIHGVPVASAAPDQSPTWATSAWAYCTAVHHDSPERPLHFAADLPSHRDLSTATSFRPFAPPSKPHLPQHPIHSLREHRVPVHAPAQSAAISPNVCYMSRIPRYIPPHRNFSIPK